MIDLRDTDLAKHWFKRSYIFCFQTTYSLLHLKSSTFSHVCVVLFVSTRENSTLNIVRKKFSKTKRSDFSPCEVFFPSDLNSNSLKSPRVLFFGFFLLEA